jgi:2,3-bisphosphoglycerate-dependent phosphoglycerate mutase
MSDHPSSDARPRLLNFVRHGATAPNLAGLRCGGDLDEPLTALGRQQARDVARQLQASPARLGLIVSSGLQRTDETAGIIAQALGGLPVTTLPAFAERRLGAWNRRPIAETQPWLAGGLTPPGGEARAAFFDRIAGALEQLWPLLPQGVLLVGSKGVARVLGEITGRSDCASVANSQLLQFTLTAARHDAMAGSAA